MSDIKNTLPKTATRRPARPPSAKEPILVLVDDGAALLNEVREVIRRYLILDADESYDALVLWIVATHLLSNWEHATRLAFISPEKRCGKTRGLDMVTFLAHSPLKTANATVAAIVRSIKAYSPTLIFDEVDAIFGTKRGAEAHDELRGILNAGHARGADLLRWDVKSRSLERLDPFAMCALASIRDLPDTIMDRSIVIRIRRRRKDETVLPFRQKRDGVAVLHPLRDRIAEWAAQAEFMEEVAMPVEDRAADNWEPLFQVAEAAGGEWPRRAHAAALAITTREEERGEDTFGVEVLRDIRRVWSPGTVAAHTETVIAALIAIEEAPWASYGGADGLSPHHLARLLAPYDVRSGQVKVKGLNKKGYRLDGWVDRESGAPTGGLATAWAAYLDAAPERAVPEESGSD